MPLGDPGGEGGFAQRGYNGPAQPGGNVSSGVGGGNGDHGGSGGGSGPAQSQNFVGTRRVIGQPYGITPFAVPRRDQTLQDRQFGYLGAGMVGTGFGPGSRYGGSGSGAGALPGQPPMPRPKPRTVRRNPITGQPIPVPPAPPPPGVPLPRPAGFFSNWQNINDYYGDPYPSDYPHPGFEFEYPGENYNPGSTINKNSKAGGQMVGGYAGSAGGWGGGFAAGGTLPPGQTGLVGELGPELIQNTPMGTQVQPLTYPPAPVTDALGQGRGPLHMGGPQGRDHGAPLRRFIEQRMAERAARKAAMPHVRGLSA